MDKNMLLDFQNKAENLDKLREDYQNRKKEFDEVNKFLMEDIETARNILEEAQSEIKADAEDEYQKTKNKKLLGGIGIRLMTDLIYDDEKAFSWAKEHGLCLTLDKRGFEKVAKSTNIPFVEMTDRVVVTFPPKIEIKEGE